MEIKLTEKQFRRLLDLVYIGNWVLNSTRGDDRIRDYDQVESLIFSYCLSHGMAPLTPAPWPAPSCRPRQTPSRSPGARSPSRLTAYSP